MKKKIFVIILIVLFSGNIYAIDFSWDFIDALFRSDLEQIENIIRTNIQTMSESDKRIVMNFAINFSSGETTLRVSELLLRYNIRPTSFDLFTAIDRNRQNNAIQFLIQNGAVPNGEILLLVMNRQRFDLARQFIEAGVDVNFQYPLTRSDADGMTSLLYASKWENSDLIKLLVRHGANINAQTINGDTALSIARTNNNDIIYNYLTGHGAIEFFDNTPPRSGGIATMLGNQFFDFQMGTYQLSGENRFIRFSGNRNAGNINFIDTMNNRVINGFFRIIGNNLTITLDGLSFNYRLDSNQSFSGNEEVWIRTGN
ncbi:MAG: ankyrin repeat domain-containing protein [Treponema sp.]|nr:ankyrin repeat domain-containing protein [Treponema sp.]